jgi:hypothetical protein
MIPVQLLDALGLAPEVLEEFAGAANDLARLYEIAGSAGSPQARYFRFINRYISGVAGSTRKQAAAAYKAAKFYTRPQDYLRYYDEHAVIDRRLASVVERTADQWVEGQNYRYHVTLTITFQSGYQQEFYTWVYTRSPGTFAGIMEQATAGVVGHFKSRSKPKEYGGKMSDYWITGYIDEFVRYTLQP